MGRNKGNKTAGKAWRKEIDIERNIKYKEGLERKQERGEEEEGWTESESKT